MMGGDSGPQEDHWVLIFLWSARDLTVVGGAISHYRNLSPPLAILVLEVARPIAPCPSHLPWAGALASRHPQTRGLKTVVLCYATLLGILTFNLNPSNVHRG